MIIISTGTFLVHESLVLEEYPESQRGAFFNMIVTQGGKKNSLAH